MYRCTEVRQYTSIFHFIIRSYFHVMTFVLFHLLPVTNALRLAEILVTIYSNFYFFDAAVSGRIKNNYILKLH